MIGNTKEEHLESLEWFVKQPVIFGVVACQYFLILRRKYPYEFIHLMRQYRANKESHLKVDLADLALRYAICEVNNMYAKLNDFLIHAPTSEEQKKEFNKLVEKLQALLQKQKHDN